MRSLDLSLQSGDRFRTRLVGQGSLNSPDLPFQFADLGIVCFQGYTAHLIDGDIVGIILAGRMLGIFFDGSLELVDLHHVLVLGNCTDLFRSNAVRILLTGHMLCGGSDGRSELFDHPIEGLGIHSTHLGSRYTMRILLIGEMGIHSSHLLIVGSLYYSAHLRSGNRMGIFFVGHVLYGSGDGGSQLLHHAVEYSGIHSTDLFHSHIVGVVLIGSMFRRSGQRSIDFRHLGIVAFSGHGTNLFGGNTMRVLHIGGMLGSRCQSRIYLSHLLLVGIGIHSTYLSRCDLMGILHVGHMGIHLLAQVIHGGIFLQGGDLFVDGIDQSGHCCLRDKAILVFTEFLIDFRTVHDLIPVHRLYIDASLDQLLNVSSNSFFGGNLCIRECSGILVERSGILDRTNGTLFATIGDQVILGAVGKDRLPLLDGITDFFQGIRQCTTVLVRHGFPHGIKHGDRENVFVVLTGRTRLIGVDPSSTLDNFITKQTHIYSLSFLDLY